MAGGGNGGEDLVLAGVTLDTSGVERGVRDSVAHLARLVQANERSSRALDRSAGSLERVERHLTQSGRAAERNAQAVARSTAAAERAARAQGVLALSLDRVVRAAAGYVTFQAAVRFLGAMTRESGEAEQATAKLEALLRSTGGTAGVTRAELNRLADDLSRSTLFDDEQIRDAEANLLAFGNIQGKVFREAVELSTDLSALFGRDLSQAAMTLGRALVEPAEGLGALKRVGVAFTDEQERQIKNLVSQNRLSEAQAMILARVRGAVGGVAEEMNTGLTGASANARKAWDELLESMGRSPAIGGIVEGVLEGLAAKLNALRDAMPSEEQLLLDRLTGLHKELPGLELKLRWQKIPLSPDNLEAARRNIQAGMPISPDLKRYVEVGDELSRIAQRLAEIDRAARTMSPVLVTGPSQGTSRSAEVQDYLDKLRTESETVGKTSAEIARYTAAKLGASRADQQLAASLAASKEGRESEAADTKRRADTLAQLNSKYGEQAATAGMTAAQVDLYRAAQAGASDAELAALQAKQQHIAVVEGLTKAQNEARSSVEQYIARLEQEAAKLAAGKEAIEGRAKAMQSATEGERAVIDLLEVRVERMRENEAAADALAKRSKDAAEASAQAWQHAMGRTEDVFAHFFGNVLKGEADAFRNFALQILGIWQDMLLRMLAKKAISAIFGPLGNFLGDALGSLAGGGGSSFGVDDVGGGFVGHAGGVIGRDPLPIRALPMSAWHSAPRLHSGGLLGGDEVPAILRRGEGVFTPEQMRALAPAKSQAGDVFHVSVPITISAMDGASVERVLRANKGTIAALIAEAIAGSSKARRAIQGG